MIGEIINHLWQSTVFVCAAGLLTLAFRRNRAQVRYWVWLSASVKFLVPFALLMSLGSRLWDALPAGRIATQIATPAVSATVAQITEPFSETFAYVPTSSAHTTNWIPFAIACLWAFGFLCVALMRFRGWVRMRAALRASSPIDISATVHARSSPGLIEPGVLGFLRPVLLLPEGIVKNLTPAQLEAVLAHEQCHIRRHDNLTSAIHMLVEAVFWFHPVVWWIGAKLIEERERACDEAVLSLGGEPSVYAEGILNVCKSYLESPLRCVSGVSGADLKKRIRSILHGRIASELSFGKKLALAAAAAAVIATPILVGMLGGATLRAQSVAAERPKFEAASIRLCKGGDNGGDSGGRGGKLGDSGDGPSPGRLNMPCSTLAHLIEVAYVEFPRGERLPHLSFRPLPIEGGPAWIRSEQFEIHAETETGNPDPLMMRGPMLQTLLEDRFQLKIHHDSREVPVYEITVAKGGPKLQPFDGSCNPIDTTKPLAPQLFPEAGEKPACNIGRRRDGVNFAVRAPGTTVTELANYLSTFGLGRLVVDKTGITGRFDMRLEFAADETMPALLAQNNGAIQATTPTPQEPAEFPSIFSAFEKLGLKLVPAKGPGDFVVIDHVERPSEN